MAVEWSWMKRDMDEPVNIDMDPEDALRLLVGVPAAADEVKPDDEPDDEWGGRPGTA